MLKTIKLTYAVKGLTLFGLVVCHQGQNTDNAPKIKIVETY
jgi:hypothetical protein